MSRPQPRDTRPHKSLTDPTEMPWLADVSDDQATALWLLDYLHAAHGCAKAKLAADTLRPNTAARSGRRAELIAGVATTEHHQDQSIERAAAAPAVRAARDERRPDTDTPPPQRGL